MTLQEIFDYINDTERSGGVTIPAYILAEFNKLSAAGITEMTDTEAQALFTVIENRLTKLLPCDTIYSDSDEGETAVKRILKYNLYSLVVEIRNMVKAISKDIATSHSRSKFNPIDNTDIDNAADETDLQSFSYVNNMITQIDYLNENSKTLGKLFKDFASICYVVGTASSDSESSSSKYVDWTTFEKAVEAIEEGYNYLDENKVEGAFYYVEEPHSESNGKYRNVEFEVTDEQYTQGIRLSGTTKFSVRVGKTLATITKPNIDNVPEGWSFKIWQDEDGNELPENYVITEGDETFYISPKFTSQTEVNFPLVNKKINLTSLIEADNTLQSNIEEVKDNLDKEVQTARAAEDNLEKYCDNLDATKAAQSDLQSEITTRQENVTTLNNNIVAVSERVTTIEGKEATWDAKSTVTSSTTAVEGADTIKSITINGTAHNLPEGGSSTNHLYSHFLVFTDNAGTIGASLQVYTSSATAFTLSTWETYWTQTYPTGVVYVVVEDSRTSTVQAINCYFEAYNMLSKVGGTDQFTITDIEDSVTQIF